MKLSLFSLKKVNDYSVDHKDFHLMIFEAYLRTTGRGLWKQKELNETRELHGDSVVVINSTHSHPASWILCVENSVSQRLTLSTCQISYFSVISYYLFIQRMIHLHEIELSSWNWVVKKVIGVFLLALTIFGLSDGQVLFSF